MRDDYCNADIRSRIGKAKKGFAKIPQLLVLNIDLEIRKKLLKKYVWSVALLLRSFKLSERKRSLYASIKRPRDRLIGQTLRHPRKKVDLVRSGQIKFPDLTRS